MIFNGIPFERLCAAEDFWVLFDQLVSSLGQLSPTATRAELGGVSVIQLMSVNGPQK